jgi:predicted SpoU family rRNA methylase
MHKNKLTLGTKNIILNNMLSCLQDQIDKANRIVVVLIGGSYTPKDIYELKCHWNYTISVVVKMVRGH